MRVDFSYTLFTSLLLGSLSAVSSQAAQGEESTMTQMISLDGGGWWIATDPGDKGRQEKWYESRRDEAKPATVPCTIQKVFGEYTGLAWYWSEFTAPANPHGGGRYLLRFWKVDYKADVWVNGQFVGTHEDGDEPFVFDATGAIKPGGTNRLAVRVLNTGKTPIDGLTLQNTAAGPKRGVPGTEWNFGGILDSVELLVAPAVYVEDLHLIPDWKSGGIQAQIRIRNSGNGPAKVRLSVSVAPATSGGVADATALAQEAPAGDSLLKVSLHVPQHRLWELDDPALYRVTARLQDPDGGVDERSERCGFRDFRFADGYFRFNGRRIFLRSAHILVTTPVKIHTARDRDLLRKDVLYAKAMGFNAVRYLPFAAPRAHLELADELGIMVMQSAMAGWSGDQNLPYIGDERFERSFFGVIRRDRNHPCVTMWAFLNEVHAVESFHKAVALLPKVRDLDNDRICFLNSGRQHDGQKQIGSLCNPGAREWDPAAPWDWHCYVPVPHDAGTINMLRTTGGFLSEYGIGAALDLPRLVRQFEQLGATNAMDAQYYRRHLDRFMADWKRWNLAEIFGRPEDYFHAAQALGASHRTLGFNAIRSNPKMVGFSMTSLFDHVGCGEGPITMFRDLKPGHLDAMRDGWAPLRFCLFAEPYQIYRGGSVRIEAVLANEDRLRPGDYDIEVMVLDPDQKTVFKKTVKVTVADPKANAPMAIPVLAETIKVDGPAGRYRLAAQFVAGGAPEGRPVEFYVGDAAAMPPVKADIAIWGEDAELATWLKASGIACHPLAAGAPQKREVILVAGKGGGHLSDLARHIARGSTCILLSPLPWPRWPLKGDRLVRLDPIAPGLYHRDDWARRHAIFDGLPCGGFMDWTFYRNIVPKDGMALSLAGEPDEAICGGINTVYPYSSGLYVGIFKLGAGRLIANALNIRPNLGRDPVADRLLHNLLNCGAQDAGEPLANLPPDFDQELKGLGYE